MPLSHVVTKLVQRVARKEKTDPVGAEYFYLRLAFRYRFLPDDGILDGVDAVAGDNAAPGICQFWHQVADFGDFVGHYRRPGKRRLLLRCSEEDLPRADIQDVLIREDAPLSR